MLRLHDVTNDDRNSYNINIDYKYFMCKYTVNNSKNKSRKVIATKELFFTYEGMLRVLFISRNNKISKFVSWEIKTLFAGQLGSVE
jgi:hypothetical protein